MAYKKLDQKMCELTKEECDEMLGYLKFGGCAFGSCERCMDVASGGTLENLENAECYFVFGKSFCAMYGHAQLVDFAINLLEYNNFEIPGDPEDYAMIEEY